MIRFWQSTCVQKSIHLVYQEKYNIHFLSVSQTFKTTKFILIPVRWISDIPLLTSLHVFSFLLTSITIQLVWIIWNKRNLNLTILDTGMSKISMFIDLVSIKGCSWLEALFSFVFTWQKSKHASWNFKSH